jgi:hypothetical protein
VIAPIINRTRKTAVIGTLTFVLGIPPGKANRGVNGPLPVCFIVEGVDERLDIATEKVGEAVWAAADIGIDAVANADCAANACAIILVPFCNLPALKLVMRPSVNSE